MPDAGSRISRRHRERTLRVRVAIGVCLTLATALCAGRQAAAHQIELPTGNILLGGADARDFIYVNDPNGCTADFITAASPNPSLFQVAAVDMNTKQVGPFGSTAIAFNRVDQVFAVRSMAPADSSDVGVGQVQICWVESSGSPCDEDNCAAPVTVDITVLRNQQADGAIDFALDAGDPVNLGSGGLYLPHRQLLDLGGPMRLQLTVYYDSKLFTDGLIGMGGFNWLTNFDWLLLSAGNNKLVLTPRGRLVRFEKGFFDSTWTLRPQRHIPFRLLEVGGNFVFIDPRDQRIYTFDPIGKLLKIEDGRGNAHTLTHDFAERVQTVSDGKGRQLTFTYGTGLATVSAGSRTVTFGYTGNNVTSITDAAGHPTTFVYAPSGLGLLESETRPEGNTPFTQTWDAKERVLTQTDALGNAATFFYDDALGERTYENALMQAEVHSYGDRYQLETYVDPLGVSATAAFDSVGRRSQLTDREGATTNWTYHPGNGKLASVLHADGQTTNYSYTSRLWNGISFQDLTGVMRPDASSESFGYDAQGRLTSWTDAAFNTWTYTYNSLGQVTSVTNPASGMSANTWNSDGTLDTATDPAGNTISFAYDAFKRPNKVTNTDGSFRTMAYDDRNLLTAATNEENETTGLAYDANGNLTSITSPLGRITTFGYDVLDRLVRVTDDFGNTDSVSYDAAGRVYRRTDANGNVTLIGRDARGFVTSRTDGAGKVWSESVDDEGVLTGITTPLGRSVAYTSDDMGRITGMLSPLGNTITVAYDAMGRMDQLTDPLGRVLDVNRDGRGFISQVAVGSIATSYIRNAFGQITELTDPRGKLWSRTFDSSARLVSQTDPLARTTSYGYDNRNRLVTTTFPGGLGTVTHTYDDASRLTALSYSDGTNLAFTFDADGRRTSATGIVLGYDDADRLTSCNGLTMTYDPGGRLASVTLAPGKTVTYTYDGRNLPTSIVDWVGGVTSLAHDDDRRLTSISRPNGVVSTYVYDDDGRVTSIQHGGLGNVALVRDDAGQIVTATRDWPTVAVPPVGVQAFTYDDANQVNGHGYDANGRLLSDGTHAVSWDLADRATTIDPGTGPVAFTYDAGGRPLTRAEDGVTREFVWNYATGLPALAVEREAGTGDVRYFIHTPSGILLHSVHAADDARQFHHEDELGNVVFLTDDAGTVVASYAYDPWGALLAETGAVENRFRWGGTYGAMGEGALYRLGVRIYNPLEARWLSRDPVEGLEPRDVNPYQALYGNPELYVDPLGTEPLIVLFMIIDAIKGACGSDTDDAEAEMSFADRLRQDRQQSLQRKHAAAAERVEIEEHLATRQGDDRREAKMRLIEQKFDDPSLLPPGPSGFMPPDRFYLRGIGSLFKKVFDDDYYDSSLYPCQCCVEALRRRAERAEANVPPRAPNGASVQPGGPLQVSPKTLHELWMDEFLRDLVPAPGPPAPDDGGSPDSFERPPASITPNSFLPSAPWEPANVRLLPRKLRGDVEGPRRRLGIGAEIESKERVR